MARLRCFRGIDTLSALALHLEVHDWQRFERAPRLASWLGLTPSLSQSGESSSQGPITKTGSGYARRLLVEAAKHYGRAPRCGVVLARRQEGQPDHVLAIAWRAQHRLFRLHVAPTRTRQAGPCGGRRRGPRTGLLPLGRRRGPLTAGTPPCPPGRRRTGSPPASAGVL